jgi:hypothetical protein
LHEDNANRGERLFLLKTACSTPVRDHHACVVFSASVDPWPSPSASLLREKIARGRIAARLANVPQCLIGIEAGMATHYWLAELGALGHDTLN